MKLKNMKKRYWTMDLQLFADGGDGSGSETVDDDGGEGDDDDSDDDDDSEEEEKKFSQRDVDEAVKKRLAREKRKWQREQQKKAGEQKPDGKGKTGNDGKDGEDDEETQKLRSKAAKAEEMELKWTCLEHDVDKSCVDDVLALARVHMAKDKDMDIEDAIDEVLKKYPQFKVKSSSDDDDDEDDEKKKSWGQRQNGQKKKSSGVEAAFLKRNPGLKID